MFQLIDPATGATIFGSSRQLAKLVSDRTGRNVQPSQITRRCDNRKRRKSYLAPFNISKVKPENG